MEKHLLLNRADAARAALNWPALAEALATGTIEGDYVRVALPSSPPPITHYTSPITPPHLGDHIAGLLRLCGIASAVARLLPRGTCGCARRQSGLNALERPILVAGWLLVALLILARLAR